MFGRSVRTGSFLTAAAAAMHCPNVLRGGSRSLSSAEGQTYDLIVIGAGSGGLACAKRSASYGKKVAVIEDNRYGGTCVNVGCVPKKVMYNTSHVRETIHEAKNFGFEVDEPKFNWEKIKAYRDRYVKRLNGIYSSGLQKLNITMINGTASFDDKKTVRVGHETYKADNILIAVGGTPNKLGVPGDEYAIDSDGFFELEKLPKKATVLGAGYIAVELAGVLNGLGSDTSLMVRGDKALRSFDPMLSTFLDREMKKAGMNVVTGATPKAITKEADGTLTVHTQDGRTVSGNDVVLKAIGRHPKTDPLKLDNAGVATGKGGYITVDEYQNTSAEGVFALGDVCGNIELTPMAIAAGRRLADRLFGGMPNAKADYTNVPTVVFSHPVIATCGLTEDQAVAKYGSDNVKVYNSTFVNLYYGTFFEGGPGDKPLSKYKLICEGPDEKVVGLHMIGKDSDEVLQGFGVAMKMGATKADFDSCIAIHPTAGEEMVTLPPWGLSGAKK